MELYKEIYLPSHHRAKKCGCVDEHIIIAEKKLGRDLKPEEVVHHKDLNKRNNDPENLMIFVSNAAHSKFHKGGELVSLPECKHPSRDELLKDIEELKTNVAISKKYGVSDKTIAKWRKKILT